MMMTTTTTTTDDDDDKIQDKESPRKQIVTIWAVSTKENKSAGRDKGRKLEISRAGDSGSFEL